MERCTIAWLFQLRQITENDDRFEGGKPIPQKMLDKYQ